MLEFAAQLLLTYALHSSLLLGSVLLAEAWLQRRGLAEAAWRAALLGAWLSSALALALALRPPPALELPQPAQTIPQASPQASPVPPSLAPAARVDRARAAASPAALPALDLRLFDAPLAALTGLWLLGAAIGLLALLVQALRLSWQARRLPPWPDASLAGPRGVRLHLSPAPSPWAWAGRVGLPAWLSEEADPAVRQAVLAHELAHLQRRDPAWRLLTRAAACLGWLQPLNRLALRRLDVLMEADCDRRAALRTGRPEALAEGLLRCAERLRGAPSLYPAARPAIAMLGDGGPALLARLRLLLEPSPMPIASLPHARWWLAGALLLSALALPAALLPEGRLAAALDEAGERFDALFPLAGGRHTLVRTGGPGLSQELRWQGRLQLNETEDEVVALDGPLHFRERRDGLLREWRLTPQAQGLQAEYRVNGQVQPAPDAEAKAWIVAMLRMAIEATEPPLQRAKRIFARDGQAGLQRFLDEAGDDYRLRSRIEAVAALLPAEQTPPAHSAMLLAASQRVQGDFERRQALQVLGERLPLDAAQWRQLLGEAAQIGGDFEAAELLRALAARIPATLQDDWAKAVAGIESDFEQRRVLESMLARDDAADWMQSVLGAAQGLGSGFEQRQLLEQWAARMPRPAPAALAVPLAEATQRISADFERREALLALLRQEPREPEVLQAVLRAGQGMSAGFERLQLLRALAPLLPADGSLDAEYRALARGLSTHERGEAEQALDR